MRFHLRLQAPLDNRFGELLEQPVAAQNFTRIAAFLEEFVYQFGSDGHFHPFLLLPLPLVVLTSHSGHVHKVLYTLRLVSGVLETSNKEFAKWERYCREQGDLLRALEDLAAQERAMYELDNRKDQIMTVCKLALANLAMWTRNQCFPASYAHATWARLAPFFQLPGVVISNQHTVSVQLRPFHDRQYNRDLSLLCQRVNEKQLHLPDGRLLLFQVQEMARPILHQQQRLNA